MKILSQLTSRFKASPPPAQEEIEQHLRRLNMLLLAYKQVETMTVAEWMATEREIEMELQWFAIHRLKVTSTQLNKNTSRCGQCSTRSNGDSILRWR